MAVFSTNSLQEMQISSTVEHIEESSNTYGHHHHHHHRQHPISSSSSISQLYSKSVGGDLEPCSSEFQEESSESLTPSSDDEDEDDEDEDEDDEEEDDEIQAHEDEDIDDNDDGTLIESVGTHRETNHSLNYNQNQEQQQQQTEIVISDVPILSRARASLPASYLYIDEIESNPLTNKAIYGVFARKSIPQKTQFGPVEGIITEYNPHRPRQQPNLIVYISDTMILDQSEENSSNWMRFVRSAKSVEEQNLMLVAKDQTSPNPENLNESITITKFFFMTTRAINACEELKVWYSKEYAERFNLDLHLEHHHQHQQQHQPPFVTSNNGYSSTMEDFRQNAAEQPSQHLQLEQPIQAPTTVPGGHKLRNKMAKTQQQLIQQQKQQTESEAFSSLNQPGECPSGGQEEKSTTTTTSTTNLTAISKSSPPQYQCDICKKVFPRFYSLKRHKSMHSGEKKFKCTQCGMSFSDVYNRNRHAKRHLKPANRRPLSRLNSVNRASEQVVKAASEIDRNNSVKLKPSPVVDEVPLSSSNPVNQSPGVTIIEIASRPANEEVVDDDETEDEEDEEEPEENNQVVVQTLPVAKKSVPTVVVNNEIEISQQTTKTAVEVQSKGNNVSNNNIGLRPKPYRCPQCYKTFTTDERLLRHAMVHTSDPQVKPVACDQCDKRFLNNSALSCHLKVHNTPRNEAKKYDCVICKQWFDCTQARREHVQTHLDPNTGRYSCPHCPKRFEEFVAIRKHIRAFHSNRQYPCTQCDKIFPRPDKLKLHMLRHSDHREFLCQSCGKQFKRKDKLKEHMQRMHAPDREAKLAAKQAAKQAQQMQNNHKKFIPKVSPTDYHRFIYKCHTCLLGFKRRGMLVNHLAKRHPDISPDTVPELNLPILKTTRDYYCQYCDKTYKSSSKRKAHILKNHPGKPLPLSNRHKGGIPVVPGLPNPTFSATVGSITTHPHYCNWCHKQYASKAKLLQHQRKKHPDRMPQINASIRSKNRSSSISSNSTSNGYMSSSVTSASSAVVLPDAITTTTTATSTTQPVMTEATAIETTSPATLTAPIVTPPPLQPPSFPLISTCATSLTSSDTSATYVEPSLASLTNVTDASTLNSSLSSPMIETTVGAVGDQTGLNTGSSLITILGNIGNLNSIVATVSCDGTTDLHDLLQANPSANDLLTQAMSELTQTRDHGPVDDQSGTTLIVPVSDHDVTWT